MVLISLSCFSLDHGSHAHSQIYKKYTYLKTSNLHPKPISHGCMHEPIFSVHYRLSHTQVAIPYLLFACCTYAWQCDAYNLISFAWPSCLRYTEDFITGIDYTGFCNTYQGIPLHSDHSMMMM